MKNKVTFKEVAKLAGVSTQTVSRVTNNAENVNPETRKKVQAAIDQLGYVPNRGAQLLVRKETKLFGVITLDISLQGASRIVEGIRKESKRIGYTISLTVIDDTENSLEESIRDLKSQQVEAILMNIPVSKDMAEKIVQKHGSIPFVFIDADPRANVSQVSADNYKGAELAAQLMIQHKRYRFALINGPQHSPAAYLRNKAWKSVIHKANATIVAEQTGDWSARSGYTKAMEIFAQAEPFNALLVANDQMALGALRACKEHNISIPQTLAVIGFDDTLNSEFFYPPLTTIRQNFLEIGHQAVCEVFNCINNQTYTKANIPVKLIERQSTSPLKKDTSPQDRFKELITELKDILPQLPL